MSKATETKEEKTVIAAPSKSYAEITEEGFEGTPFFFEMPNDVLEGIYCGAGRVIGKGQNETNTIAVMGLDGIMYIIPAHIVIVSSLEKRFGAELPALVGKIVVEFTYKGKVKAQSGSEYHNYAMRERECSNEEVITKGLDF